MKQAVLVTGGAGFIGSHVADAYLAAGSDLTVLDNLSSGRLEYVPDGARFVHSDVRSSQARELLTGGAFSILNHHAAQMDVRCSVADPVADASINVLGLLNLLQGAQAGGVRRVVFASSGGTVYGDDAPLPIDERAAKLPASPYGAAKLSSEHYLAVFARLYGIQTVALRYSNVYGPRQNPHGEAGVVAIFSRKTELPPSESGRDLDLDTLSPQLPEQPRLDPGGHLHHAVHLHLSHDLGVTMQRGEQLPVRERDRDASDGTQRLSGGAEYAPQPLHSARLRIADCGLRIGRGENRMGVALAGQRQERVGIGQQIGLVEEVDHALAVGASTVNPQSEIRIPQFAIHYFDLLLPVRMRCIDDVQQHVRLSRLF